jgi:hypothetical protein
LTSRNKSAIIISESEIREDTKMRYYVVDALGNFICTEEREEVARQMAENLGGDYIPA